jgi:hypothetical protein
MTTALINDFIVRSGIIVQGTTVVTSSTGQANAAQINSGLAVTKNANIGTLLTVGGDTTLNSGLKVSGSSTLTNLLVTGLGQFNSNVITTGTLNVFGIASFQNDILAKANVRIDSLLTATGASSLLGGLTVNNGTTLNDGLTANGVSTFDGTLFATGTTAVTVGIGPVNLGGTLTVAGNVIFNTSTTALVAGGGSGALKVAGGAYVGDNLIVNSTAWDTGTNTSNALYVKGGAWIDESLVVSGPTTFRDIVIFNGTATYVLSTNTVYTDNLLQLHIPPGGDLNNHDWTYDDGKDIGLVFHYYKGVDKNAFLGFSNASTYLEWFSEGDEGASGVFTGTVYGTFRTGAIVLVTSTNATNTVSGALQVAGGVGVGLDVYVGGTVNAGTLQGRNLTQDRLVLVGASGQLTDDSDLTWNSGSNQIEGRIAYANTATSAITTENIKGGSPGAIPYQLSTDTTTFLNIGNNGYVLQSDGSTPYWGPATGVVAGTANTATNLANGQADQIPYQTAPGQTTFSSNLRFNGTTFTTTNVVVSGTTDNQGNAVSGSLQVAGGAGIAKSLYVGTTATISGDLYVDGQLFLQGQGITDITGSTGTFQYLYVTGTTGTGLSVSGDAVIDRNLLVKGIATFTNIISQGGTFTALTATNAYFTNVSLTGDINVSGVSAVNVTATNIFATTLAVTGQSTLQNVNAAITTVTTLTVTGNETIQGNLAVTGISTFTGKILVTDTTNALATNVGSIVTLGGIGVAQDVVVGGSVTIGSATANTVVPAIVSNNVLLSSFTSNTISSTSTQNLDSFSSVTYRTARYLIQIVDGSSIHVSEMTVFHDGTNVFINEYGISTNNGQLGSFDATLAAGTVTLKFIPTTATSMVIKVVRMAITS